MGFNSKYGLEKLLVGRTKLFEGVTPEEHKKIKRSAHNYNIRTDMYFITRYHRGVVAVTRVK